MSTDAQRTDPASGPDPAPRPASTFRPAAPESDDAAGPFTPVARTAADLLAIMPHTLGMWPRRSAVLLTATESHPGPCLRVDLPGPGLLADEAGLLEWIVELCELLGHDPLGDRLYLALFTDGSPLSEGELGIVAEAVGEAAALSGHSVAGQWIVGPQVWSDLDEPEPRMARDVREIRSSALWTAMVVTGSAVEEPTGRQFAARHHAAAATAGLRVEDCLALVRELERRAGAGPDPEASLAVWEALLCGEQQRPAGEAAAELSAQSLADLLAAVCDPLGSDALVTAVLTGEHPRAARAWHQARDLREETGVGRDLCWMADVLVGRWGGRPDWSRAAEFESVLEALLDLLQGAAAAGHRSEAALDAEAWLWVATAHLERFRARGTRACHWLQLAEDAVPGHEGAARVRSLGSSFPVPLWAGDPERTWHRDR